MNEAKIIIKRSLSFQNVYNNFFAPMMSFFKTNINDICLVTRLVGVGFCKKRKRTESRQTRMVREFLYEILKGIPLFCSKSRV